MGTLSDETGIISVTITKNINIDIRMETPKVIFSPDSGGMRNIQCT